jgi:5-methylcytosine-specific restriction endonuclease McrA
VLKPIILLLALCLTFPDAEAKTVRSPRQCAEFVRLNPCPVTGKTRGKCPGWEVDHVIPLKCGGADHPANMQWLTVEDHKAKTRREAKLCRR